MLCLTFPLQILPKLSLPLKEFINIVRQLLAAVSMNGLVHTNLVRSHPQTMMEISL